MSTPKLSHLLMAGVLFLGFAAPFAFDATATEAGGSALPPGVNPSSPAGGNGGDAQGYEKKPANPEPTGSEKKADNTLPPAKHTAPSQTHHTHSTQKKAHPTKP